MPRKVYRRYDPRLKNLVANSNDISHFYKLGIPKSTLKQWKICGPLDYFSIPELDFNPTELLQENVLLKSQLSELDPALSLKGSDPRRNVYRNMDFGKNKGNKRKNHHGQALAN
jgi:hypothetical protein